MAMAHSPESYLGPIWTLNSILPATQDNLTAAPGSRIWDHALFIFAQPSKARLWKTGFPHQQTRSHQWPTLCPSLSAVSSRSCHSTGSSLSPGPATPTLRVPFSFCRLLPSLPFVAAWSQWWGSEELFRTSRLFHH